MTRGQVVIGGVVQGIRLRVGANCDVKGDTRVIRDAILLVNTSTEKMFGRRRDGSEFSVRPESGRFITGRRLHS